MRLESLASRTAPCLPEPASTSPLRQLAAGEIHGASQNRDSVSPHRSERSRIDLSLREQDPAQRVVPLRTLRAAAQLSEIPRRKPNLPSLTDILARKLRVRTRANPLPNRDCAAHIPTAAEENRVRQVWKKAPRMNGKSIPRKRYP